jgi:hypothetical protein
LLGAPASSAEALIQPCAAGAVGPYNQTPNAPRLNRTYRALRRIDRNLIPSAIAFCATAPGVRRSFLAAWGPESLSFANVRRFFTSSFDHATNTRRFAFAINVFLFQSGTSYRRGRLYSIRLRRFPYHDLGYQPWTTSAIQISAE